MGTKRSGADDRSPDDTSGSASPEFDTVRRGYRPEQVDSAVRELQWRLEVAERERREAQERVESLGASLEAARAGAPDTFGMRAEKILRMAEHDAGQRRGRADDDAEQILADARAEAEQVRAEARAEAERSLADAAASVARMRAEAAAARRETDQCADAAASMHEHVLGLRSAVRGEIARLHAAMGAELRTLDEMVPAPEVPSAVVLPEQRPRPSHAGTGSATEPADA